MTDTKKILKAAVMTPGPEGRMGLPILAEGSPGTGKTSNFKQLGRELGLHVEIITASNRAPEDFAGLPIPDLEGETSAVDYAPPVWAIRAAKACADPNIGGAIVGIDEVTTCAARVQAALLRVVNEGVIGDFVLPPGVRFLLACNSVEEAAGGHDLTPPFANRMGHVSFQAADVNTWTEWLLAVDSNPVVAAPGAARKLEQSVLKNWDTEFAKAKGMVSSFLTRSPGLLMKMPKMDDPNASKAWPSPRSWELATRALAGGIIHGLNEPDREEFFTSFIGIEAAGQFLNFQKHLDLPNIEDLLDGKIKWKPKASRPDVTHTVLNSAVAMVTPPKAHNRKDRAQAMWNILGSVAENNASDVAYQALLGIIRSDNNAKPKDKLLKGELAFSAMKKLKPMMDAVGLTTGGR